MRKIKILGNIIAICLFFGAFFGFFIFLGLRNNPRIAMPIDLVNAVFVDKKGQIYVGCVEANRIQVFDKDGNYLYSNTFGAFGSFYFYVGTDGIVNVYAPGDNMGYVFQGKELLSKTRCSQEYENNTVKMFKAEMNSRKSFIDLSENIYSVKEGKIYIKRAGTDYYSLIKFKVPLFPLSYLKCGIMFALGLIIFAFINQKAISNLTPEQ